MNTNVAIGGKPGMPPFDERHVLVGLKLDHRELRLHDDGRILVAVGSADSLDHLLIADNASLTALLLDSFW